MDINITSLTKKHYFNLYNRNGIIIHKKESITKLPENSIFVFGSNTAGRHAKYAKLHFGAEYGKGVGLQGQSYALPTSGDNLERLDNRVLYKHVKDFILFACRNKNYTFVLTKVGCGAGYPNAEDMYMYFLEDVIYELDLPREPENIIYPAAFISPEW